MIGNDAGELALSTTTTPASDGVTLEERIADLEGELEEARFQPWPQWAEDMKKQIREVSGYDGYDDATDGVNLPDELSELINELTNQAEKNVAEARASRKLDELERAVEHYRNGMNEWIAKAQALTATTPTPDRFGEGYRAGVEAAKAVVREEGPQNPEHDWTDYARARASMRDNIVRRLDAIRALQPATGDEA